MSHKFVRTALGPGDFDECDICLRRWIEHSPEEGGPTPEDEAAFLRKWTAQ